MQRLVPRVQRGVKGARGVKTGAKGVKGARGVKAGAKGSRSANGGRVQRV